MVYRFLRRFSRISLTKRFALLSFAILLAGMLIIGWWVSREIETGVLNRTASVTASYVTSFASPHLQNLGDGEEVTPEQAETLDGLLFDTALGQRIVSFKVWSQDGRILYSPKRELIGRSFGVGPMLETALEGETVSRISPLADPENEYERQFFSSLQETYTPLRQLGSGEIKGAVEFYEGTDVLVAEVRAARIRSWLIVGVATVAMYIILLGMVKGASLTIGSQRRQLEDRVGELREALSQNQTLNSQLRAVSAVAMAANEIRDQEGMLGRCLEAVLEHTSMDAAAIRLLDAGDSHLTVASSRGAFQGLPCSSRAVGPGECPCGYVASRGLPLYLSSDERQRFRPPCCAPEAHAVAILPLKSTRGLLGVLSLSRSQGGSPGPEERDTLEAISSQVATAIRNTQLLGELARVEAQRELGQMKAEFISAVSHELRTPLGFIKGYATTLSRQDISVDPATRQEFLQVINEESDRLQRMIDDLLDASRLQAGRLQVDRRVVSLKDLLEGALHKLSPGLKEGGHVLVAHLAQEKMDVLADPIRVEQVVHNLVDNAARYSDPGARIEVIAAVQDHHAMVSVKDYGDGIPGPELGRVFEPFFRGSNARRRGAGGTGLGLAICRGIVESHGGELWVESSPGQGSVFRFTLPLAPVQRAAASEEGEALPIPEGVDG